MAIEQVFGISFWSADSKAAEEELRRALTCETDPFTLTFVNPEILLASEHDAELRHYIDGCHAVFPDGAGIVWASKLGRGRIRERITGTDFQWRIFALAAQLDLRIFLYGGQPGVAERAVARIRTELPTLQVDYCDGYGDEARALARIRAFEPAIVMVCLGNPRQERWIMRNGPQTGARMLFGNGGSLDFIAGEVRRAPRWMRDRGFEWLWRLGQEPSWTRVKRQARLSRYLARLILMWIRR